MLCGGLIYEASLKPWAHWVTHFRNDWREIFKARRLKGSRQSSIFKGTALGVFQICLWGCQRLTNVFSAIPDGHMYSETVQSLQAEQLRKWPQLSPGNRPTHSRDASIECVVMAEAREAGSGQIWKHCCQGDHSRGRRQLQTVSWYPLGKSFQTWFAFLFFFFPILYFSLSEENALPPPT